MSQALSHRDLIVWQKAMILCKKIYVLTDRFPSREQYALSAQMRRCAVSIPSNVAEGRNRRSRKDYGHFLQIAYSSSAELETQLILSKDLEFIDERTFNDVHGLLAEISRMLHVMIDKIASPPRT